MKWAGLRRNTLAATQSRKNEQASIQKELDAHVKEFRELMVALKAMSLGTEADASIAKTLPPLNLYVASAADVVGLAFTDLPAAEGRMAAFNTAFKSLETEMAALSELIKVDLERGWKAGRPKPLAQYLREYPELGLPSNPPEDLLAFESELCRRHGGFPTEIHAQPSTKGAQRTPDAPSPSSADSVPNDQVNTIPFDENHVPSPPKTLGRPTRIGRYRIVEELGRGTFGAVVSRPRGLSTTQPASRLASQNTHRRLRRLVRG